MLTMTTAAYYAIHRDFRGRFTTDREAPWFHPEVAGYLNTLQDGGACGTILVPVTLSDAPNGGRAHA